MTAREIFEQMGPLIGPLLEAEFDRRDLCILATRVALEAARYFGIEAEPVPVKVIAYNAAFAQHVADNFAGVDRHDVASWGDDSWSVGTLGHGELTAANGWSGHLIAVADGCFGDFSIQQVERPQHSIVTGPALVGPYSPPTWKAVEEQTGTVIEYSRIVASQWRNAPDWKDAARRRPIVGKLIRALRAGQAPNPHRYPADAT